jgi:Ca2+-binding RTX toxin-like protein
MRNIFQVIDPVPTTPAAVASPAVAPATNSVVTATAANGVLDIEGTPQPDNIFVSSDGTNIHVTANGSSIGSFSIIGDALTDILVNGKGGADTINIDSSVLLTASVNGGAGADSVTGGGGDNVLIGGNGSDTLVGGGGTNVLFPGPYLTFSSSTAGKDVLVGGSGFTIADLAYRTDGLFLSNNGMPDSGDPNFDEKITIMPSVAAIWGGSGADTIIGTVAGEFLSGGNGPDSITGGGANDLIVGGLGKDTVSVADEPVTLYLRDGKRDHYRGVNNVDEDILELDSKDRTP